MSPATPGQRPTTPTLADAIAAGERRGPPSGSDIASLLDRIADEAAHAQGFRHTWGETAVATADGTDTPRNHDLRPGPLAGLPIGIKSNIAVRGEGLECGSKILEGYRTPFSATVVERVQAAGLVPLGSTHMDEFAVGSRGDSCAFARPVNPWDSSRSPGGSSSGSAIAVALGWIPAALGSDTGGSVRIPAAWCGVTGFRPTYGRLSRFGLVAHASSMDQIGLIARDARGLAQLFEALSGHDPRDATSLRTGAVPAVESLPRAHGLEGLRVARLGPAGKTTDEVNGAVDGIVEELRGLGASVTELGIPGLDGALSTYAVLACAEAASNLARYDGLRYGAAQGSGPRTRAQLSQVAQHRATHFGPEVRRRIHFGTEFLLDRDGERILPRARVARARLRATLVETLRSFDLLLSPTADTTAPRLHRVDRPVEGLAPPTLAQGLEDDRWTVPASLAGLPAISLPAGLGEGGAAGCPIGIQLVGRPGDDALVLRAAQSLQERTHHHLRTPPTSMDDPWIR